MDRRGFLRATARLAALAALGQLGACTQSRPLKFDRDPFTLGVASGDPSPTGVVLWTRLAPDPLAPGGGMPDQPFEVRYELSQNEDFRAIVRKGTIVALPDEAHSAREEIQGLGPEHEYF